MAARALWSGSISFGLLQIPITVHTAEERAEEIHFRQLDKKDLAPIKYERVSSATGKPVEWKNIVKGFEYEKDTFVVLDPEEVREARPKATQTIDIQDFVPKDQIDPAYFETPYFVVPQKRSAKAYALLRKALEKKGAIAVATFVLRTKEHLCALMPVGDSIMLETLRYGHELKKPSSVSSLLEGAEDVTARELAMAEQLIDGMMTDFDPKKYKDRFYAQVMKMIAEKAKTGEIKAPKKSKDDGEVATDVVDLLELLKKSVAGKSGSHANDVKKAKPRAKRVTKKRKAA